MVGLLLALIVFRRWRHLFTFLGSFVVLALIGGDSSTTVYARPRPYDVTTIGRWAGFSLPGAPVAVVTFLVLGITYTLVVAGPARTIAKVVGRGRRRRSSPSPSCTSASTTRSTSSSASRSPWRSRSTRSASSRPTRRSRSPTGRGKTAHLDVGGRRGEAIREAVEDQLGLTVLEVKPVGPRRLGRLDAAAAPRRRRSRHVPVREALRDEPRAGRPLVQARAGRSSTGGSRTRRRSSRCAGSSSTRTTRRGSCATPGSRPPTPYGIVEMTPEREYLLVTEFFDGAAGDRRRRGRRRRHRRGPRCSSASSGTPGSPTATSSRPTCWCSDGQVLLIDVAFVQVRPSPWRQAVDLANMMLVLAVRTDAERVYERALALLHAGRDRRGVRRGPGHRQPDAAAHGDEAGRARPARAVPGAGARSAARSRCSAGASDADRARARRSSSARSSWPCSRRRACSRPPTTSESPRRPTAAPTT